MQNASSVLETIAQPAIIVLGLITFGLALLIGALRRLPHALIHQSYRQTKYQPISKQAALELIYSATRDLRFSGRRLPTSLYEPFEQVRARGIRVRLLLTPNGATVLRAKCPHLEVSETENTGPAVLMIDDNTVISGPMLGKPSADENTRITLSPRTMRQTLKSFDEDFSEFRSESS